VLVANRRSLTERPAQLLPIVHELLERLDAHLKAEDFYSGESMSLILNPEPSKMPSLTWGNHKASVA
jgi:hypothetical protein